MSNHWACVIHYLASCPISGSTKLCSQPNSPICLETSSTCEVGDFLSLNLIGETMVSFIYVEIKVQCYGIFLSNTLGIDYTEKTCFMLFFGIVCILHHTHALDSYYSIYHPYDYVLELINKGDPKCSYPLYF